MAEPIRATLKKDRERVRESIKSEIRIPGFPIPIIKGKLNSIVAPSHSGKTIYAIALAFQLAREGHKVMFLSTEEDKEAFIEKTMNIPEEDIAFDNMSFHYQGTFDKPSLTLFIEKTSEEKYDFLVIDYIKKSMWAKYTSDHVVMEEINSTMLKTMASLEHKISVFALVQGNRESFEAVKDENFEELVDNPSEVAILIDGGMPTFRSADNLLFIRSYHKKRTLLVAKTRRNAEYIGQTFDYDVDLDDFSIRMEEKKLWQEAT